MEPTSKSQKISTSRALIIEEKDLVLFLDWLKIQYLRIELEAVCNGNISITNLDAGRLLEQLTVGHHRLLTLNVTAFAESIHPEPYRRFGSLRLRIGTRWDGTVVADLSGTDDRFYRVRDRIQQFLDSCTAWYHPIYSCRLCQSLILWITAAVGIAYLLLRIAANVGAKILGYENWITWVDAHTTTLVAIAPALALFLSLHLSTRLISLVEFLFPAVIFNVGADKAYYSRLVEIRKWVLGSLGALIISAAIWAFK